MDPISQIISFNAGRDPERLALKYNKMRANAFAFLRGSCDLFYSRLALTSLPKSAPLVWVCGDLHLENFGSYKGANRLVYFDVNDFDEAALAPASWDLIRLLTSICLCMDGTSLSAEEVQALCARFLSHYCYALAVGKAYWVERDTAQGPVRALLDGLKGRTRVEFLDARTEVRGKRRVLLADGTKALAASPSQREQVMTFMSSFAADQTDPNFFKVLDVARRVAGTGSLGLDRFVILVKGKGSPDSNYLLDLKLATPSSLFPYLRIKQPKWPSQAHRAVAVQQRCQAVPMGFSQAVTMGGKPYVLRGLQPSEDRVSILPDTRCMAELEQLLASMGQIVAWTQLRSSGRQGSAVADDLIGWGQKTKWQQKMTKAALACAKQVRADAHTFNTAYDEGRLGRAIGQPE